MNKIWIGQIILNKLKLYHRGEANAISREKLRAYFEQLGFEITDRKLRAAYASLPVVTSERGIFWPISKKELDEYRRYLQAKAIPLFERWRMVAEYHLGGTQLELFDGQ